MGTSCDKVKRTKRRGGNKEVEVRERGTRGEGKLMLVKKRRKSSK